jgi:hypothetical protein
VATSGIFHHFINPFLVKKLETIFLGPWIIIVSIIIAIFSLGLSFPLVWLVNKFTPQLVGKPLEEGPFLPNLGCAFSNIYKKLTHLKKNISNEKTGGI